MIHPVIPALIITGLLIAFNDNETGRKPAIEFEKCVDTKFQIICKRESEKPKKIYYEKINKVRVS